MVLYRIYYIYTIHFNWALIYYEKNYGNIEKNYGTIVKNS